MKKLRYLILTDHSKHSVENSVYALARTLSRHPRVAEVCIASRGNKNNRMFFSALQETQVYALKVKDNFDFQVGGKQFSEGLPLLDINDFDAVWLRLPRPVSDDFLYFLEDKFKGKQILNSPHGIRLTSSKKFLLNFPDLCPPMRLVRSVEELNEFAALGPIVIKPLKEYGGKGIVKIVEGRVSGGAEELPLEEYLSTIDSELQTEGFLAMKFLENVKLGDKRILVVDGQIMAASLRLPAEGSWLCNVAQGGKSIASEAEADELKIIERIAPRLKAEGILMFGADTLTDDSGKRVLSEINTLSIGGFPQAEMQTGRPILRETIDLIVKNYPE